MLKLIFYFKLPLTEINAGKGCNNSIRQALALQLLGANTIFGICL